jgi:FkbM family methyltransferase
MSMLQRWASRAVRTLGAQSWATRAVRPIYGAMLQLIGARRGIAWSINGVDVRIDPRFRWQMAADYDRPVAGYLSQRVRAGDLCLDVGANVGVYVLQLAAWCAPVGRVIAFEPNPNAREVLQRHVQMNGLEARVEVIPDAVGREAGAATFFGAAADGMSRLGSPNPRLSGAALSREAVRVTSLDEFCGSRGLQPNWILIDIEGSEIAALAGARELLRRRGAALGVVVEMHPASWADVGTSLREAEMVLAEIGRRAVPLTGQSDPLREYGIVSLEPAGGDLTSS